MVFTAGVHIAENQNRYKSLLAEQMLNLYVTNTCTLDENEEREKNDEEEEDG